MSEPERKQAPGVSESEPDRLRVLAEEGVAPAAPADGSLGSEVDPSEAEEPLRCDFCGRSTESVRRVALDRGYDRLQARHAVRYACPECSARKEAERTGGR